MATERPADGELLVARTQASAGSDLDLVATDRRSRGFIAAGRTLAQGQALTVLGDLPVRVLGAGRGRRWFLAAWREDGVLCYGTFSVDQIAG